MIHTPIEPGYVEFDGKPGNPVPGKTIWIQWKPLRTEKSDVMKTDGPYASDKLHWYPYKGEWAIVDYKKVVE